MCAPGAQVTPLAVEADPMTTHKGEAGLLRTLAIPGGRWATHILANVLQSARDTQVALVPSRERERD